MEKMGEIYICGKNKELPRWENFPYLVEFGKLGKKRPGNFSQEISSISCLIV
jgi:hypothetical protein